MITDDKSKNNFNIESNLSHNLMLNGINNIKDILPKNKDFKRYKFHIFHHNGLINSLKATGIDINLINNILNINEQLIFQLILKNNDQNELKKNIYKAFSEILKSNPNLNSKISQNALNIIQLYNENYAKKINDNLKTKNYKKIQSQKDKKNISPSSFSLENIKNTNEENIALDNNITRNRRLSLNPNINNNKEKTFSLPIKLDDFTKKKFMIRKKGRSSEDISSNKAYKYFIEKNNIINKSSTNIFKKISIQDLNKTSKRNNSTFDLLSSNSNNILFINNKKNLTNITNNTTNKFYYIRNNKKPNLYSKTKSINNNIESIKYFQPHIKGSVSFKKMLSRDYLNRLGVQKVDGIYSTISPSYDLVEPKCIMKVSYSNKRNNSPNTFKGLGVEATFDMDKMFFKYNNHNPPKGFKFDKRIGRGHSLDEKLPLFMSGQVDRNSCYNFNDKNLKLNYYANGRLRQLISCLNEKKSFNFKLKDNKEEETEEQKNFENFAKEIFEKGILNNNEVKSSEEDSGILENKLTNSIQFRVNSLFKNFMAEYKRKAKFPEKIDGITFKNFKIANSLRTKKNFLNF